MSELRTTRIALPTGITLNVQTGGNRSREAIIFLHGFPESHRTWRELAPALSEDHFVVAPDQRGFGGSDRPEGVENYRADRAIADLIALADILEIDRFTLVGHDWGGAIAWGAALKHPERVRRLIIANAPHPLILQKSLIEDPAQRAASQYMRAFRNPAMEVRIAEMGLDAFFGKMFGKVPGGMSSEEREAYLGDWRQEGALTAMLNWYRASDIVVPDVGEDASMPDWCQRPFPHVTMPTLVIWAMGDTALLPVQLSGLHDVVDDLRVVTIADAGHFVPWEKPEPVLAAILDFLAET